RNRAARRRVGRPTDHQLMESIMFRKFVLVTAAALVILGVANAAPNPWEKQIDESGQNLQASRYAASEHIIDRTIADMVERLGGGQNELFATALTHKALATAGSGNVDDALWYWYVAQQISPAVAKTDLSSFGAPGEYLARHPLTQTEFEAGSAKV